ncbi:MAG: DUF3293 domain-containing protein [Sterolibacteriaceae bacterium]|uniref:DUF3293 domain-containing protein n=1 Tax=Candidatus Methylophosphatis roskildensis TaxID=2899263 RepID=A0A9D7E9N2_9PROT|nr:DUF3293 domain-containing protein [Candidatus Methylophosphatis roskildensis]MBK7664534.1 DUF3293 domain-containing protein [Sterolibacteriaceae bacterium]MBK9084805.1 DUF3293 domain-containing protein [Sterolibacteriaceae bacterium]
MIDIGKSMGNATPPKVLRASYLRTTYRVCANGIDFDIMVGRASVGLDRWLRENGWTFWAFISACNPGSRLLSGRMNRNRHEALISHLADRGRIWFPAVGVPNGSSWPSEPSVFVPTISVTDARWIGKSFGQNALLYGKRSTIPRLLWCSYH